MKHFATKREAKKYKESRPLDKSLMIFKKLKGMRNRVKKPYLVGTYIEWLNQY